MILNNKIKRICVVVNSRDNYARVKSLLTEIIKNKKLKLILVLGASATLYRFGEVHKVIRKDRQFHSLNDKKINLKNII